MTDFIPGPPQTCAAAPTDNDEDRFGQDAARLELLRELKSGGYRFISVTPATHARVLSRAKAGRPTHRDIFGWNRTFAADEVDSGLLDLLERAGVLARCDERLKSEVRVSSLGEDLFLHSGFPTKAEDAVFFGPDTYRFAHFIEDELVTLKPGARIVDMGAGSGAGGILCGRLSSGACVSLVDVNPVALDFARLNAAAADVAVQLLKQDEVPQGADLIVANPPYMIDAAGRTYRDGGDLLGGAVALQWVQQALARLAPEGRMLLYTGVAIVDGRSPAIDAIAAECARHGAQFAWREIDCDVFGEELCSPAYADVERIAAVGCTLSVA
jgi:methylase of polypeptide subunit release factors